MVEDILRKKSCVDNKSDGGAVNMKFLFHNDKATKKDELFLLMFILISIGAGVLLYIFAPNGWIISNSTIKALGIVWIIAGVMFIPGFIYRLCTNDTSAKK